MKRLLEKLVGIRRTKEFGALRSYFSVVMKAGTAPSSADELDPDEVGVVLEQAGKTEKEFESDVATAARLHEARKATRALPKARKACEKAKALATSANDNRTRALAELDVAVLESDRELRVRQGNLDRTQVLAKLAARLELELLPPAVAEEIREFDQKAKILTGVEGRMGVELQKLESESGQERIGAKTYTLKNDRHRAAESADELDAQAAELRENREAAIAEQKRIEKITVDTRKDWR